MHKDTAHFSGKACRRTSPPRFVLALLCVVGLCASLLQQPSMRVPLKVDTSFQAAFMKDNAIKRGKPCKRMVPGAVGNSCSSGPAIGLEATTSVVLEPLSSTAENSLFADMTLGVQWRDAPQFRPPRFFA